MSGPDADAPLWIFGYGSLVWRPAFAHAERRPARLEGFARRLWQGSTDHRGVPGAPGRVATLVAEAGEHCWGTAYRVAPEAREAVLGRLDHREKGGYARHRVRLRLGGDEGETLEGALVYVATAGNPDYLGPAPLPTIAAQVARASGPSGTNREYVLRLDEALRAMGAEDPHVAALAALLRAQP